MRIVLVSPWAADGAPIDSARSRTEYLLPLRYTGDRAFSPRGAYRPTCYADWRINPRPMASGHFLSCRRISLNPAEHPLRETASRPRVLSILCAKGGCLHSGCGRSAGYPFGPAKADSVAARRSRTPSVAEEIRWGRSFRLVTDERTAESAFLGCKTDRPLSTDRDRSAQQLSRTRARRRKAELSCKVAAATAITSRPARS